ncbi:hypothetical protein COX08_03230 [Candidatus Beckwithbacteria bacterium CG23_combo_of_CG06-09_8_20_14_all_34_8]|uniref:Nif3-like dinuclear metal center hexameric protein n=1 Tax=Candidatus Beckwithbacteria bacterium CG23_combo_of_CG06-09_8_20_14_all_34_8 TaxID=1974497 RepID=A0A2H0B5R3_9BACT|nr:MAG: hypothetical protein COX08_03230 [Candidatus Beckwithbacteria bacterium CG23_combo_of_CG06-09_8_20_14_all_34_8]
MNVKTLFNTIHNDIIGPDLLAKAELVDHNANGIQIMGDNKITKVALGVSCNLEFLQKAVNWGAQVCIFHHGLGLGDHYIYNSKLLSSTQQELKFIFDHELTIAGYHYCLDAHNEIGNNIQIIKKLGAVDTYEPYFENWGWIGEFEVEKPLVDLAKDCSKLFKHDVFMVKGNKERIKRIGVCSGGAMPYAKDIWQEIIVKNIDAHITGVITESGPALARENGFAYFAAGHYATEVLGVKALGEEIKKVFPEIETNFIEVWNEW